MVISSTDHIANPPKKDRITKSNEPAFIAIAIERGLQRFSNKRRNLVKMVYWDGYGILIFAKRLEKGRFSWPVGSDKKKLVLTAESMLMLVSGIDLKEGCKKAWYER